MFHDIWEVTNHVQKKLSRALNSSRVVYSVLHEFIVCFKTAFSQVADVLESVKHGEEAFLGVTIVVDSISKSDLVIDGDEGISTQRKIFILLEDVHSAESFQSESHEEHELVLI